jgi:hypothetical protein
VSVKVCEPADEPYQTLAQTWSADKHTVNVAKSARGFDFDARLYIVYWLAPPPMAGAH